MFGYLGVILLGAVLLMFTACQSGSVVSGVLPDTAMPFSAERKRNSADQYAMLVARYGKPDSILSTENDSPRPKVSTRMAHYRIAHLKVAFTPNGCVEAYERAIKIVAESSHYPAIAEDEMRRMEPCVPPRNAGWTIVGYIDSSENWPISSELARSFLDKITAKRAADPTVETGDGSNQPNKPKRETRADRRTREFQETMRREPC